MAAVLDSNSSSSNHVGDIFYTMYIGSCETIPLVHSFVLFYSPEVQDREPALPPITWPIITKIHNLRWVIGYLSWVQSMLYVFPLQWLYCMKYDVINQAVKTLDCSMIKQFILINLTVLPFAILVTSNQSTSTVIYINGLGQERRNSIANALDLRLSCSNLLIG